MSFASANGHTLSSATVDIPRARLWVADVSLSDASELDGLVSIRLGPLVLNGAVFRAAEFTGARSARIVGGVAGWRKRVDAKWYANGVLLSQVIADVAREVGETVVFAAGIDRNLGAWTREAGQASETLTAMVGADGWYVRPDGATSVGEPRDASRILSSFTAMQLRGAEGRWLVSSDALDDWQPGRQFITPATGEAVWTIEYVQHTIRGATVRTEVRVSGATEPGLAVFAQPARRLLGHYEYRTITHGDDVHAEPTDPSLGLPALTGLAYIPSLLGETVALADGALVVIVFLNGDPARPRLAHGGDTRPTSIAIDAGDSTDTDAILLGAGAAPVIRNGDTILVPGIGAMVVELATATPPFCSKVKA